MSTPLRELPGHQALQAMRQLEWRFQTLQEDFQEASAHEEPVLGAHDHTFQFSRRDQLYEAEKILHHYLSGYYTYWRQVMTVGHATGDPECRGRIEGLRSQHDDKPSARITRGLRMYVQKENVLPILLYQSDHDNESPRYAINMTDIQRDGLYDPNWEYYFSSVDGACIFPFKVLESNWNELQSLHSDVQDLVRDQLEEELEEYKDRLEQLEEVSEDVPLTDLMEDILPTEDPLADGLLEEE